MPEDVLLLEAELIVACEDARIKLVELHELLGF
jgi:hypothetical protein